MKVILTSITSLFFSFMANAIFVFLFDSALHLYGIEGYSILEVSGMRTAFYLEGITLSLVVFIILFLEYDSKIVFRPFSLWLGVHYSEQTRKICTNILPIITIVHTEKNSDLKKKIDIPYIDKRGDVLFI